jgi:phosphoribosyl-dephospho-CoA transferase
MSPLPIPGSHHLLWLNDAAWQRLLAGRRDERQRQPAHWQRMRWPVVVRRRDVDARADEICVGIACRPMRRATSRASRCGWRR